MKKGDVRISYLIAGIIAIFVLILVLIGVFRYGGDFSRFFSWLPNFKPVEEPVSGVNVIRYDTTNGEIKYFAGDKWQALGDITQSGKGLIYKNELKKNFKDYYSGGRGEFKIPEQEAEKFKDFSFVGLDEGISKGGPSDETIFKKYVKVSSTAIGSAYFIYRPNGELLFSIPEERDKYGEPIEEYTLAGGMDENSKIDIDKLFLDAKLSYSASYSFVTKDLVDMLKRLDGKIVLDEERFAKLGYAFKDEILERFGLNKGENPLTAGYGKFFDFGDGFSLKFIEQTSNAKTLAYRFYFEGKPIDIWYSQRIPSADILDIGNIEVLNARKLSFEDISKDTSLAKDIGIIDEYSSKINEWSNSIFNKPIEIATFKDRNDPDGSYHYYCAELRAGKYIVVDLDKEVGEESVCGSGAS